MMIKGWRDVVDENDNIISRAPKEQFNSGALICRVAFIMLANRKGELLLHQRSSKKRFYPLYWSGTAAGHLNSGESYEEAAHRELREEIGVLAELEFVGKFYSPEDHEMVGVFLGYYDGDLTIEPHEVEQVRYFSPEQLEKERTNMLITSFVERSLPLVLPRLPQHTQ